MGGCDAVLAFPSPSFLIVNGTHTLGKEGKESIRPRPLFDDSNGRTNP